MTHHGAGTALGLDLVLTVPFLLAGVLYVGGVWIQARRGRSWPWYRTVAWLSGTAAALAGFVGPLAALAHEEFVAHAWTHLLIGMVAPLLLVTAAPVTLALRSLQLTPARRLTRLLSSRLLRIATVPTVAVLLNVVGLWLLYFAGLYEVMQRNPVAHVVISIHFLVAGCILMVAIIPVDPSPHRASYPMRMVALVLFMAAHSILAKAIYADPPSGVAASSAQAAAQLMYYAGDLVDAAVVVLLCARWYRDAGRRLTRPIPTALSIHRRFRSD